MFSKTNFTYFNKSEVVSDIAAMAEWLRLILQFVWYSPARIDRSIGGRFKSVSDALLG